MGTYELDPLGKGYKVSRISDYFATAAVTGITDGNWGTKARSKF